MSMVLTGNKLWKSVENFSDRALAGVADERRLRPAFCYAPGVSERPLSACSACPGDYEDPDRTAWAVEPEEPEEEDEEYPADSAEEEPPEAHAEVGNKDEFPAKEA